MMGRGKEIGQKPWLMQWHFARISEILISGGHLSFSRREERFITLIFKVGRNKLLSSQRGL